MGPCQRATDGCHKRFVATDLNILIVFCILDIVVDDDMLLYAICLFVFLHLNSGGKTGKEIRVEVWDEFICLGRGPKESPVFAVHTRVSVYTVWCVCVRVHARSCS